MENEIDCKHINNTQEDSGVATAQTLEECLDVLSQDIRGRLKFLNVRMVHTTLISLIWSTLKKNPT